MGPHAACGKVGADVVYLDESSNPVCSDPAEHCEPGVLAGYVGLEAVGQRWLGLGTHGADFATPAIISPTVPTGTGTLYSAILATEFYSLRFDGR